MSTENTPTKIEFESLKADVTETKRQSTAVSGELRRHVYTLSQPAGDRKADFTQGVACILQGSVEHLEGENGRRLFECVEAPQVAAGFVYDKFDELISRFIQIRYTGDEDIFGNDKELTVIIPHCLSRSSALYREPVIKIKVNSAWSTLPTEEAILDEYKDGRFVQVRMKNDLASYICVVSQYKTDTIKFSKQLSRNTSSVDQRFTIKAESGTFHGKRTFPLQLQPIDSNTVNRLNITAPNGRCLLCSSNIVSIGWGEEKVNKSLQVILPIPANPVKMKKLAKAEQNAKTSEQNTEKKRRQEVKKEEKVNKWYMGIYGEDENDVLYLFHFDHMSESWTHLPEVKLTEIRKDLLSFSMPKLLHKFLVLRCRTELTVPDARKLVYAIEEQLTLRPVRFILFQSPKEHSEVTIQCVSSQRFEAVYEELYQEGWKFHGSHGPPTSKEIMLKEGSVFDIGFRGNIKFDEKFHPPGKKLLKYYNSQLPCQITFTIIESDKHLQKNYDFYKGLCLIQSVDKSLINETAQGGGAAVTGGYHKTSSGSLHNTKRAASQIVSERKKALCELLVQLAKGIDTGAQTPPASKLPINLDPVYDEAIQTLSTKLGKEWEVLGKNLGLSPGRIEAIKTRNRQTPDKLKEDMLYTWIKRQPKASDRLPKLYYALMNCGRIDLAYKMEDLYCDVEDPQDLPMQDGEVVLPVPSDGAQTKVLPGNDNLNNAMSGLSITQSQERTRSWLESMAGDPTATDAGYLDDTDVLPSPNMGTDL